MKTRYLVSRHALLTLLLALGSATYASTPIAETISVIPQPFWSTLRLFRSEPKVSLILLVPNIAKAQPDYAAVNGADLNVFGDLADDSNQGFTPIVMVPEERNREAASVTIEPGNSHKLSPSSNPTLADNWSRIAGVGSTVPAYDSGFGTASGNVSTKLDSPQGALAGSDLRATDQFSHGKATVTDPDAQSIPLAGPGKASQSTRDDSSVSIGGITITSDASKLGGTRYATPKALSGGPDALTGTGKDFQTSTNLLTASNYQGGTLPSNTSDVRLTTSSTVLTDTNNATLVMESLTVANGTSYMISNTATGNGNKSTLTIGNASGFTNVFSGIANDLIFLTGSSSLNLSATGSQFFQLTLANSGNFNVGAGSTLAISTQIAGGSAITITGGGLTIFSGTANNNNTYTGTTTVSAGVLNIQKGTALGTTAAGTSVTSGAALLIQGGITVGAEALTLNGTGISGTGALKNVSDANVWQGTVTLGSATRINSDSGSLTFNTAANSITATNQNLTLGGAGDGTVGGTITIGTGTLTKDGVGTWTLSGANTYSGLTNISAGTLILNGSNSSAGATTVTSSGTLQLGGGANGGLASGLLSISGTIRSSDATARTVSNSVSLTSNSATFGSSGTGGLTFNGTIDLGVAGASDRTISTISNVTFTNVISGNSGSGLVKNGSGTLTFSGTSANTYDGLTTINLGELDLNKTAGVNAISGNISIGDNSGTDTVKLLAANQIANTSDVTINASGVLNLNNNAETIDALNSAFSTASVSLGTGTLTIGANDEASATFAGVISGSGGALIKTGAGAQTLTGANSYTGATNVNAGILNIQNAMGLGTTGAGTTVASGATLQLQGGITVGAENLNIQGAGAAGQNGALVNVGGTNNYGGLLTLAGATTISSDSGTLNLTNAGTITGATFNLTLTGSGSGSISSVIGTTTGSLTKSGSGTWTLNGLNTYTGLTSVTAGTLAEGSTGSINDASNLTVSGSTAIFDLGSNHSDTVGTVTLDNGGAINGSGSSALTSTGTFEMKDGSVSAILAGSGIALNKTTGGTVILSGINTYTGTTTISAGALSLINGSSTNNIAGSTTIVDNAILNVTGLNGSTMILASGQTLKGTGTVFGGLDVGSGHLAPGNSVGTITLDSLALSIGSILDYEFNNSANDFTIVSIANGLTLNGGGFNLYQEGSATPWTTNGLYSLIGYTGALNGSLSNLSVLNPVFGKSYTFGTDGSNVTLTIDDNATPATAYWQGNVNTAWNGTSGLQTNFTTDLAGTTNANQLVGSTTDVFFTANGGTQVTTTLGQNFAINSLTFNGNASSSSNISGNTLTLNAGSGDGITVDSGSGSHTISSNVALGADQSWTNNSANTLTMSGVISGAFDLTTAGIGTIAFSGSSANTYSGLTTVSAGELDLDKSSGVAVAGDLEVSGGTAKLLGNNQIANGSSVTVSGGTLAMQGFNDTVGGVQLSSGAITGTGGTLTSTSNFDVRSGSASAILGGSVGLDKTTGGTVALTGANTYSGATTISGGTLDAAAADALGGTSGITVNSSGTLLISNNASNNHVSNTAAVTGNGGTLKISTGVSEGVAATVVSGSVSGTSLIGLGALTLTSNSFLNFDSGGDSTLLVFTSFMPGTYVLTIQGYSNTNFDGVLNSGLSADDRLVFNQDQTLNLGSFDFGFGAGVNVGQIMLDSGFYEVGVLTPVPEPSTWLAAAFALGAIVWTQRRRFARKPAPAPVRVA